MQGTRENFVVHFHSAVEAHRLLGGCFNQHKLGNVDKRW